MYPELKNQQFFSIDRLLSFCDIMDKGSQKKAVDGNKSTQTLYSRQVKQLEDFLDTKLFEPRRTDKPTDDGKEFFEICHNFLSATQNFRQKCKDKPIQLKIASGESIIQWILLPLLMEDLKKAQPQTNFIFKNKQSKTILEDVKAGKIDIGLVRESILKEDRSKQNKPGKLLPTQMSFKYQLYVPKQMARKLNESVSIEQLSELPLCLHEGPGELKKDLQSLFKQKKLTLEPFVECSSSTQIEKLIKKGAACGFLPAFVAKKNKSNILEKAKVYDVDGLNYDRKLCFIWNKKRAESIPEINNTIGVIRNSQLLLD